MSTTTKRRLLSGYTDFLLGLILIGASASILSSAPIQEPRPPTIEEEELLLQLSQQFTEAEALFDDPQRQSQSIDFLTQIVQDVADLRRQSDDVAEGLIELQRRALEHRARAFFNSGQLQGAADDFRQLILDNPRYAIDAEALSPKIVDFFEDQKKQLVGYIAVTSEPAGARVTVNGDFIGITNFFPVEVHTGLARVEVELVGYDGFVSEDLRIEPGEVSPLDVTLTRVSARLPIITDPPGVEVVVNGEVVGVTSGSLPPDLRSFMPAGFDPSKLSAPFELAALPMGQHEIQLKLDCYETVSFPFVAEEPRDYTAQILKLEESVGRLTISSNPTDARVYLDGELKGNTPLDLNRVCSGEHELEVKHATGKYVEDISVGRDESLSFECPIRPTLAVLGFAAADGVPERDLADIREKVSAELRQIQVMNVVFPTASVLSRPLGSSGLMGLVPGVPGVSASSEEVRTLSESLGKALEVEMLLVGFVPAQRLTKDVNLHLLAVGSTQPDSYALNYLDRGALPAFVDAISSETKLFGSWVGMTTVDTRLTDGPVVVAIAETGTASTSSLQVGDVILSSDDAPIATSLAFLEAVRAKDPGGRLNLGISRGGVHQTVELEIGRTPLEVPMRQPGYLYNKAIVNLRHRLVVDPDLEPLARLNAGLCHMNLGDYETALKEYLPRVTMSEGPGISQGTVYYHTAIAYLQLGERDEAARLFEQALLSEGATLHSNDGPRVAPLAQRHLRELGQ